MYRIYNILFSHNNMRGYHHSKRSGGSVIRLERCSIVGVSGVDGVVSGPASTASKSGVCRRSRRFRRIAVPSAVWRK